MTALQPVFEVGNPLGEYPDRSWERVYHDQYRYDSSFTWVCSPNDTHACRARSFVRNGVVMRIEQNYDHQTYEDLYGNCGTFARNPRMCLKGYVFHRRVYGPYRLKGPLMFRRPILGRHDVSWDTVSTYAAKALIIIAARYSVQWRSRCPALTRAGVCAGNDRDDERRKCTTIPCWLQ